MSTPARHVSAEIAILKSANVKLSPDNGTKKVKVFVVKKIESSITSIIISCRPGYSVQILNAVSGVIDGRDKLKITALNYNSECVIKSELKIYDLGI